MYKTHTCSELQRDHAGQTVTLVGWVNARRDHGQLIFLDLCDRWGVTQVVANPEISSAAHEATTLADEPNIREVIAFPKNQQAMDVMAQAPSPADPKQLEELYLRVVGKG